MNLPDVCAYTLIGTSATVYSFGIYAQCKYLCIKDKIDAGKMDSSWTRTSRAGENFLESMVRDVGEVVRAKV